MTRSDAASTQRNLWRRLIGDGCAARNAPVWGGWVDLADSFLSGAAQDGVSG